MHRMKIKDLRSQQRETVFSMSGYTSHQNVDVDEMCESIKTVYLYFVRIVDNLVEKA